MFRPNIRNRSFDRMGERYAHVIDPYHFLGRSSFDIPRHERKEPSVNIRREGADFVLELAVPGFTKEEIQVLLDDDILTVRGAKRHSEHREEDQEYILEEFEIDSFERSFKLAKRITQDQISAHYEHGVLRLTFINLTEEVKPARQVEIT